MTYSANLHRHVNVTIENLNHFDYAELDAAISALPDYPFTTPDQVRAAAEAGDLNAKLVIQRALEGDDVAIDWI